MVTSKIKYAPADTSKPEINTLHKYNVRYIILYQLGAESHCGDIRILTHLCGPINDFEKAVIENESKMRY